MRIAYLIIVHEQPELLGRLVAQLRKSPCDIYIHVDGKKDTAGFRTAVGDYDGIYFLDERIRVAHGGFSQVRTMLLLLKTAFQRGDYDLYHFLSGRDYPIKSAAERRAFYESRPDTDFLDYYVLAPGTHSSQNIYQYHFVDYQAPLPPKLKHYSVRAKQMLNKLVKRRFLTGILPYRGSNWIALSGKTVRRLFAKLETPAGQRIYKFFRLSWGSDEIFFHTFILNDKAADPAQPYDPLNNARIDAARTENYLHYIDWSPVREDPAVLDMSDLPSIRLSPALFMRKVGLDKSRALLAAIDEEISAYD